jgi:hypothetical protein
MSYSLLYHFSLSVVSMENISGQIAELRLAGWTSFHEILGETTLYRKGESAAFCLMKFMLPGTPFWGSLK